MLGSRSQRLPLGVAEIRSRATSFSLRAIVFDKSPLVEVDLLDTLRAGVNGTTFLEGGGAMGAALRGRDWSMETLGPPESWPRELRDLVCIMLSAHYPIPIMWGQEPVCLYNDAFSRSLGPEKHPAILGMGGRQAWAETWPIVGEDIEGLLREGRAVAYENQLVPMNKQIHTKAIVRMSAMGMMLLGIREAPTSFQVRALCHGSSRVRFG